MTKIHSFPPISNSDSRVLILGTMPGKESLAKNQYYANSRNAFWKIIKEVLEVPLETTYQEKTAFLISRGIALWDVLNSCIRESSLDTDIDESSIDCNDFEGFYKSHPKINKIFFNGKKAEKVYMKYVWPELSEQFKKLTCRGLPSTSPGNATKTFSDKVSAWKSITS